MTRRVTTLDDNKNIQETTLLGKTMMTCEICSHEVDENEIEVLELYNGWYNELERFWACPDCVNEHALKSKKDQDTPKN